MHILYNNGSYKPAYSKWNRDSKILINIILVNDIKYYIYIDKLCGDEEKNTQNGNFFNIFIYIWNGAALNEVDKFIFDITAVISEDDKPNTIPNLLNSMGPVYKSDLELCKETKLDIENNTVKEVIPIDVLFDSNNTEYNQLIEIKMQFSLYI